MTQQPNPQAKGDSQNIKLKQPERWLQDMVPMQIRFHQEVLRLEPLAGKQDSTYRNWSVQPASAMSEADLESVALPS